MENPREHEYWVGLKNKSIRYYFYCNKGLDTFNNFRYVFMMIFGIYFTLKLKNAMWLLMMFGVSIPLLMCTGFYTIHHMGRVIDWLNIRFGSHYSLETFKLQVEIRDAVKKLADAVP